ncbi:hypothetical protein R9X47_27980 [Wukongibacter baidiensis]|uniref:hypothetical protein n=1 Tax=Wukongibacter baidiensis TaxID=1723361 RepID=UPI003D7FDFA2
MKWYAVAVCNMLNDENEVKIVHAQNEIDAMIIAVQGEDSCKISVSTMDELKQYYLDLDFSVSKPVEIKK